MYPWSHENFGDTSHSYILCMAKFLPIHQKLNLPSTPPLCGVEGRREQEVMWPMTLGWVRQPSHHPRLWSQFAFWAWAKPRRPDHTDETLNMRSCSRARKGLQREDGKVQDSWGSAISVGYSIISHKMGSEQFLLYNASLPTCQTFPFQCRVLLYQPVSCKLCTIPWPTFPFPSYGVLSIIHIKWPRIPNS